MRKQRMRKRYEASFKARVALSAVKGGQTLSELASEYSVHGNLVSQWKKRLLTNVVRVFEEQPDETQREQQYTEVRGHDVWQGRRSARRVAEQRAGCQEERARRVQSRR